METIDFSTEHQIKDSGMWPADPIGGFWFEWRSVYFLHRWSWWFGRRFITTFFIDQFDPNRPDRDPPPGGSLETIEKDRTWRLSVSLWATLRSRRIWGFPGGDHCGVADSPSWGERQSRLWSSLLETIRSLLGWARIVQRNILRSLARTPVSTAPSGLLDEPLLFWSESHDHRSVLCCQGLPYKHWAAMTTFERSSFSLRYGCVSLGDTCPLSGFWKTC